MEVLTFDILCHGPVISSFDRITLSGGLGLFCFYSGGYRWRLNLSFFTSFLHPAIMNQVGGMLEVLKLPPFSPLSSCTKYVFHILEASSLCIPWFLVV